MSSDRAIAVKMSSSNEMTLLTPVSWYNKEDLEEKIDGFLEQCQADDRVYIYSVYGAEYYVKESK